MNKCWYSKKQRITGYMCCVLFLVCAVITGYAIPIFRILPFYFFCDCLITIWLVKATVFYYLVLLSRSYEVTEEGFFLRNLKKIVKYSWDEITEISICDVNHASRSSAHDKIIRIAIGKEKNGPANLNVPYSSGGLERWRKLSYSLRHYKKIIMIEYSEERLLQIQKVYKREVQDYRTERWNQYPG